MAAFCLSSLHDHRNASGWEWILEDTSGNSSLKDVSTVKQEPVPPHMKAPTSIQLLGAASIFSKWQQQSTVEAASTLSLWSGAGELPLWNPEVPAWLFKELSLRTE